MHIDYIILGAGPAGLTLANRLLENGITSFLVIEKEAEAGGLCRSAFCDNAPLDIGGGHFLDVRRPQVNDFLFRFMPKSEWNLFTRNTKINLNGTAIDHPLEANIWQFPIPEQVAYLKSIAQAGCNAHAPEPSRFTDWIFWKLGDKIANTYMLPYNQKMFGKQLDSLGTYWLDKLPNVSFEDTLYSCLEQKPYGSQPGHASFYYPKKYGYGELWLRMAAQIPGHIYYNSTVTGLNFDACSVTLDNQEVVYGKKIITTIPWTSIADFTGMPETLRHKIRSLQHTGIVVEYHAELLQTTAHWIYIPAPDLAHHRILVRHNFCPHSSGYWTETNADRCAYDARDPFQHYNQYAYPLNTLEKPAIMEELMRFSQSKNVFALGRWGEHEHYNSDLTVAKALLLGDKLCANA